MTREDKELLFRDLCARLPYGVMVRDDIGRTYKLNIGNAYLADLCYGNGGYVETPIKPYLRPLSSMTEEEKREFYDCVTFEHTDGFAIDECCGSNQMLEKFDWLNAHHFDYRGLIEKGLAIAVTADNNPYTN